MTAAIDSTADAFLRAICAAPADDAPRVIYADWLEENGQVDRAEFIRVQCELARSQYGGIPKREFAALRRRERELLREHGLDWLGFRPITGQVKEEGARISVAVGLTTKRSLDSELWFDRGFVQSVTLTCAALVGGPCERCQGTGRPATWTTAFNECPACTDGTLPGCRAELARWPLERVTVSDQEPYPLEQQRCAWFHPDVSPGNQPRLHWLPVVLFKLLTGFRNNGAIPDRVKWYDSRIAAHDALSAAALAWIRGCKEKT